MIFSKVGTKLFNYDIFVHSFFAFIIVTFMFIFMHRKKRQEELLSKFNEVLDDTNLLDGITVTNAQKDDLRLLDAVYENRDEQEKITNEDIKKASYNQAIIFGFCILLSVFHVGVSRRDLYDLLKDKILTFATIGIVSYLFSSIVKNNYSEISQEYIYNTLRDEIESL